MEVGKFQRGRRKSCEIGLLSFDICYPHCVFFFFQPLSLTLFFLWKQILKNPRFLFFFTEKVIDLASFFLFFFSFSFSIHFFFVVFSV